MNSENLPYIESYKDEDALTKLKYNRAPRPDGSLTEMFKEGKYKMVEALRFLFNPYLHKAEILNAGMRAYLY